MANSLSINNGESALSVRGKLNKLFNNDAASESFSGRSIRIIGDSYVAGTGASPSSNKFSTVLAGLFGLTEDSDGTSGMGIKTAPTSKIPTYNAATYKYLALFLGLNDAVGGGGQGPYNSTNFINEYTAYLNNAITTKGWPASSIIMFSCAGAALMAQSAFTTEILSVNTNIQNLATSFGCSYVDVYTAQTSAYGGPNYYSSDGTHPNNIGHYNIAITGYGTVKQSYNITDQLFAINGISQFNDIRYINPPFLKQTTFNLVGIDNTGKSGVVNSIPPNTKTSGAFYLDGNTISKNAILPAILGADDIVVKSGASIKSAFSSTLYSQIDINDASAYMNFRNYSITGLIRFYVSGGTTGNQLLALTIEANGNLTPTGDIGFAPGKKINAPFGSNFTQILFTTGVGNMDFKNNFSGGLYRFYNSNAVNLGDTQFMQIQPSGRILMQSGGTFTDIPSARFAITSTTEGFLPPRMTTAQRDAISSPAAGLLIYNTTTAKLNVFTTAWEAVTSI